VATECAYKISTRYNSVIMLIQMFIHPHQYRHYITNCSSYLYSLFVLRCTFLEWSPIQEAKLIFMLFSNTMLTKVAGTGKKYLQEEKRTYATYRWKCKKSSIGFFYSGHCLETVIFFSRDQTKASTLLIVSLWKVCKIVWIRYSYFGWLEVMRPLPP